MCVCLIPKIKLIDWCNFDYDTRAHTHRQIYLVDFIEIIHYLSLFYNKLLHRDYRVSIPEFFFSFDSSVENFFLHILISSKIDCYCCYCCYSDSFTFTFQFSLYHKKNYWTIVDDLSKSAMTRWHCGIHTHTHLLLGHREIKNEQYIVKDKR